jgi:hypothetical protein
LAVWLLLLFTIQVIAQLVTGRDPVDLLRVPLSHVGLGALAFPLVGVELLAAIATIVALFQADQAARDKVIR